MPSKEKIVKINITFRNTEPTDALTKYAEEKIGRCLSKFAHSDTEAHVVLRVEKNRQIAEVSFRTDRTDISGSEESSDLYSAIDLLVDSLTQQLRKYKERLVDHH